MLPVPIRNELDTVVHIVGFEMMDALCVDKDAFVAAALFEYPDLADTHVLFEYPYHSRMTTFEEPDAPFRFERTEARWVAFLPRDLAAPPTEQELAAQPPPPYPAAWLSATRRFNGIRALMGDPYHTVAGV